MNKLATLVTSILVALYFQACGGSDLDLDFDKSSMSGVFVDSGVSGLYYNCSSGNSGVTDVDGTYTCKVNDTVEFLLGTLSLGEIEVQEFITPLALFKDEEAALNFAQLIQSLDKDANPSNGIEIDQELLATLNLDEIIFTSATFDENMQTNGINLVSEKDAQSHMEETFLKLGINEDGTVISTNKAPVFTSSKSIQVREGGVTTLAIILTATDEEKETITYSLSGTDAQSFNVNSKTGEVTFKEDPDYETKSNYTFSASAEDTSSNITTQDINLCIIDMDEGEAPVFTSSSEECVEEIGVVGPIVSPYTPLLAIILTATDAEKETITYSLSGADAQNFNVNSETGEVTLITEPDYETKSNYIFTASAEDTSSNIATQEINICILDMDEGEAPVFTSSSNVNVEEVPGSNGGGPITSPYTGPSVTTLAIILTATDEEKETIIYSLSGTDAQSFNVNSKTGEVTFKREPDYEAKSNYTFSASAEDASSNITTQDITISIIDIDE